MTTSSRADRPIAKALTVIFGACLVFSAMAGFESAPATAATWQQEWQELIKKAKAEGKLVVAQGSSATRNLRHVYKVFEKKFGIDVALGGGRGRLVTARLHSERAAGVHSVDLVQIGVASVTQELLANDYLDPFPPMFLLPEVKDPSGWLDGHHWWGDPKTKKYLLFYSLPQGDTSIGINTKLVNPDEITSYYDLFKPKYDGLRVSGAMELSEGAHSVATMWMMAGKDWLRRWITEAKPVWAADSDVIINWLIEGKYGIAMFMGGNAERAQLDALKEKGAPVLRMTKILKEGADANPGSSGNLTAIKNAPHPNARKLFVNWFLSKEGQLEFQKGFPGGDSLRIDIPKDMVDPGARRQPGAKYRVLTTEPDYQTILKESVAYVKQLKRSVGIAAPVIKAKLVTTKITGIKRKGRSVSFEANGKTQTVSISRRRTKVTVGGKKAEREALKVGMTCAFDYPGNNKRAKSISCK